VVKIKEVEIRVQYVQAGYGVAVTYRTWEQNVLVIEIKGVNQVPRLTTNDREEELRSSTFASFVSSE